MDSIIYKNIEAERVRHGYTKEVIAQKLDVTPKTYLSWIRGTTEIPASILLKMKRMWDVSADYLLETND
ncbi:MAG: helix-turn-helix transcriptional regulator [[Eubacterium] sulci]|jgi:transcriptional regulator with XRE-family HTH domain|nr:helix-turn-helix transcriptional regulator [[Eubacterium] sulci]